MLVDDVIVWLTGGANIDVWVDLVHLSLPDLDPVEAALVGIQDALVQFLLSGHGLTQFVGADEFVDLDEVFWADVHQGAGECLEAESQGTEVGVVSGVDDVAVLLQQSGGFVQVVVGVVDTGEGLDLTLDQVPEAGHGHWNGEAVELVRWPGRTRCSHTYSRPG